jgi:Bromodomain extra-terminal - transcription regulation
VIQNVNVGHFSRCISSVIKLAPGAIAQLEKQIETMKGNLEALKSEHRNKERKKKQQKAKEREPLPPPPPPPRAPPKPQPKASTSTTKKKSSSTAKKPIPDDDVLTFEQKKDLSETIGKLEGAKLEKVINIIHEGVPEIRDVSSLFRSA